MATAPIVVHSPSPTGGWRATVHGRCIGRIAYSVCDLLVPLHGAGIPGADAPLDDPGWTEWRGGGPHQWDADIS
jgi:hypothetical protein